MAQLRSTCLVTLFLSSVLIGACAFHISPSTRGPTWSFPHRTSPTALSSSSSSNPATALPPGSSVFLLGVGFTQFLAARSLIDAGLKPVLMSDVAKAEVRIIPFVRNAVGRVLCFVGKGKIGRTAMS